MPKIFSLKKETTKIKFISILSEKVKLWQYDTGNPNLKKQTCPDVYFVIEISKKL